MLYGVFMTTSFLEPDLKTSLSLHYTRTAVVATTTTIKRVHSVGNNGGGGRLARRSHRGASKAVKIRG